MAIFCGTGSEYQDSQPPLPLFGVYSNDDIPHEVTITVFGINGTRNNTLVCSEIHLLEAGGHEKSSIKNDEGGEFRFEISIDDEVPQEFSFGFQRSSSLAISVQSERDVWAQIVENGFQG
ncbi:hypothetical protein MKMG_00538 [Methanogenium sp. MK-MG]|nr:hypothetical protein MKMG_00538 [Methanogenium sp. MK-MG]